MSSTTTNYLESIERINYVIGLAISDQTVSMARAEELTSMSDAEKRAWYEKITDPSQEVELL